jgi:putative spermidine/putrescine transport system substrate-binding protein
MTAQRFSQDCVEVALANLKAGRISRRSFLAASALAGAGAVALSSSDLLAAGKPKQIVHANWGGDAVRCTGDIYGKAFTAKYGVPVVVDGSGPLEGSIKAMVDAKNVTWDCCDSDFFSVLRMGRAHELEPVDYSIVDRNGYMAPYTHDYGVLGYWYSYVMTWDTEKLGKNAPTWADFFDVEKYPGKRTMFKYMNGALEAALLADGVPPEKIYPLDIDRGLAKIEKIKDHIVFWDSGASSQQMFLDGEVVMGTIWQTRSQLIKQDTKGRVDWTFEQGNACPAGWLIPRGNPAGNEWGNRWLAHLQTPELQVEAMRCFGQGPANPKAYDIMSAEERAITPGTPENLKRQIPLDSEYFSAHYDDALNAFLDMISA